MQVSNLNIEFILEAMTPADVAVNLQPTEEVKNFIGEARGKIASVLNGKDRRLLVICGPCSLHSYAEAIDYAKRLKEVRERYSSSLEIIMRCYFEKPRTTGGWKGYINDPDLDESFNIDKGLYQARQLLLEINEIGLPVACELLDVISPQYIADLISWGAIGARTTESQLHRELASGLSFPVGFKNATGGDVEVAIDGVISAGLTHNFLGVSERGKVALVRTRGNQQCHIILRGGKSGSNYEAPEIASIKGKLSGRGQDCCIVVDVSHGNSFKDHKRQFGVLKNVLDQIKDGEERVRGVMIESHINEGRQEISRYPDLEYGVSVTDACVSWETTEMMLEDINDTVMKII